MPDIKIYSTPSCPYCQMVKKFLGDNNLEFTNIDVSADPQAGEEMVKKSGQMGVPVTDIDGQIIIGFNREKITTALRL